MGGHTDTTYSFDIETNETFPVISRYEPDVNQLHEIFFFDEWFFDEHNFKMEKKVRAYCPIRIYYRKDDILERKDARYKMIAWFNFDKDLSKADKKKIAERMELFCTINYEFPIINEKYKKMYDDRLGDLKLYVEKWGSPFWTSYGKMKFVDIIMNRVLTAQSGAYDFESGKKLNIEQIRNRMGHSIDTIYTKNIESNQEKKELEKNYLADIYEIESVIFIENWYIDENSMRMKKEVLGVAPVRTYYDIYDLDMENPRKRILFVVYFNK